MMHFANKTLEFKQRIHDHLTEIDATITAKKAEADALPESDMQEKRCFV